MKLGLNLSLSLNKSGGSTSLLDVRPDAVMHLAVGDADCYDGVDGYLKNLLPDTDYKFNDGSMALTGAVGEAGSYLDLGDKYMSIAGGVPAFVQTIGRSNQPWWIAFGISTLDTSGGCSLFTNQDAGVGGVYIKKQGNESSVISFSTSGGTKTAVPSYPYFPLGVDNFVLYSWDGVSNVYTWHARNGLKNVKALTLPVDTTTVKNTNCNLFATYSGGTKFSAGTDSRLYSVMMGTGAVTTDAEYATLRDFAKTKDNANY